MNINILDFQSVNEISIIQFSSIHQNTFEYIGFSEAITAKFVEIKEIDQAADVNNLIAINKSDKYVFIMDGDILEGAKQNRIVNTSVLLAPTSKILLPVSCIEQGRWRYNSERFMNTDYVAPTKMRSQKASNVKKSLEAFSGFVADQSKVWENVEGFQRDNDYRSPTSNFSDVYYSKADDVNSMIDKIKRNNKANGIAVFLRKNLLSIDLFNRTEIYSEYFSKILRGVVFEAINLKPSNQLLTNTEASFKVNDFFDNIENFEFKEYEGVGVGTERRFENKEFTGLLLNYKIHLIHLTSLMLNIK